MLPGIRPVGRHTAAEEDPAEALDAIKAAARGIRARQYEATPSYRACRFCAYNQICPPHRHAGVGATKRRTGEPWIPDHYGRMLPAFMAKLLVRDISTSVSFYEKVLGATIHYSDPDFAALKVGSAELMLHADHTYDKHPWYPGLSRGARRGLGAELRLFGVDPDTVEARA